MAAAPGETKSSTPPERTTKAWRRDDSIGAARSSEVSDERRGWEQYPFDTRERHKHGRRTREWTAVAQSELEVVREMARCLQVIGEGRIPA